MKTLTAFAAMAVWSFAIWALMEFIGFRDVMHNVLWSLGAAVLLLIAVVGNIWIYFLIVKETPWQWLKDQDQES